MDISQRRGSSVGRTSGKRCAGTAPRRAVFALLVASLLVGGCALHTELMSYSPTPGASFPVPAVNQALVLFLRNDTDPTSASVFDGETFLGVLIGSTYIAYATTPGEHRFMVVSEAADFMDATLEANRVYVARVEPRFGAWRARFSLLPISPRERAWADVPLELRDATRVAPNPAGQAWAVENAASIHEKHDHYLAAWLVKAEKPKLYGEDGVPFGDLHR